MTLIHNFLEQVKEYVNFLKAFQTKINKRSAFSNALQEDFDCAQDNILSAAFAIESKIRSPKLQKKLRSLFREKTGRYIFQSKIARRAYKKPRGYPGDYLVFEMIYDSRPVSKGIGLYLDNWIFKHPLTQGIIYRKNKIKYFLNGLLSNSSRDLKILNIGCGSSREIRELAQDKKLTNRGSFILLDQDEEALDFSKNLIKKLNYNNLNISFLKKDVLSWLGLSRKKIDLSCQDVVYSIGVADYFLKTTLEYFIKLSFRMLKPKGKLIVPLCSAHDLKLYTHLAWFCEWHFYKHDGHSIKRFIEKGLGIKNVRLLSEDRQPIFFVIIEK